MTRPRPKRKAGAKGASHGAAGYFVCTSESGRIYGMTQAAKAPSHALVDMVTSSVVEWLTSEEQRIMADVQAIQSPWQFQVRPVVPWALFMRAR